MAKVGNDILNMKFNTAISALMILLNKMEECESVHSQDYMTYLQLLAPFAPHITEELWARFGEKHSIYSSEWPTYDDAQLVEETVTIVIQVNGKVRGTVEVERGASEDDIMQQAMGLEKVSKYVEGEKVTKTIHIKDKLLNIVL